MISATLAALRLPLQGLKKGVDLQARRIVAAASVTHPMLVRCSHRQYCSQRDGDGFKIGARGFPFGSTDEDILEFLKLDRNDVSRFYHPKRPDGESTGRVFLTINEETKYQSALARNREYCGPRYIEVFDDSGPPPRNDDGMFGRPPPRNDDFGSRGRGGDF